MKKRTILVGLTSITMASAIAYTTLTAVQNPIVTEEQAIRKTEWVTISNDSDRVHKTVKFLDGNHKFDEYNESGYELQNEETLNGVKTYYLVKKGTKRIYQYL